LIALFTCFAYKLWMLHASGFMALLAEPSASGCSGPWSFVAGLDGCLLLWRVHG